MLQRTERVRHVLFFIMPRKSDAAKMEEGKLTAGGLEDSFSFIGKEETADRFTYSRTIQAFLLLV